MTFPTNPSPGTMFQGWMWDGCQWVCHVPQACPPPCPPAPCPPAQACPAVTFVGPIAPTCPLPGTLWFDGQTLHIFTGSMWTNVSGGGAAITVTPPANPFPGQGWWDGTTLWIWDGTSWIAIGPAGSPTPGPIGGPNPYQVVTFPNPGTFSFTIPPTVNTETTWKFHLQAGGGGGGGALDPNPWSGQGGGAGEYIQFAAVGLPAGLVVSCTVGALGIGGIAGADGQSGQDTSIIIANTNSSVIAHGGHGGWGNAVATNANSQGLGGKNGTFTPGTSNLMLVMDIAGGDAHFGVGIGDSAVGGASSFLGQGGPSFNDQIGWNDTSTPSGFGAGGRGAYNNGDEGGPGTGGLLIIERFKN